MAAFTDLRARALSGAAMAGLGAGAIWLGGPVFIGLVCVLSGLMVWELTRMLDPAAPFGKAEAAGFTAAVVLAVFTWRFEGVALIGLTLLVAALLAWRFPKDRAVALGYTALILLAGLGLIALRGEYGMLWVLWLVALVVGSDVAGGISRAASSAVQSYGRASAPRRHGRARLQVGWWPSRSRWPSCRYWGQGRG